MPAPGAAARACTAGFGRWNQRDAVADRYHDSTLNIVDDTFDAHRDDMDAFVQRAKARG
jgi:hypothetical protein